MRLPLLAALLCVLLAAPAAWAQEDPRSVETSTGDVSLRLSGTFQPRLSFGLSDLQEEDGAEVAEDVARLGFGIRRARFRATATFGSGFGVHYDVDVGSGDLASVDLYGFYSPSPRWRLRAGYLAGPQPRAYVFTSHTRIDAVERAAIAERWSRSTIGSRGRTFGAEARYQTDEFTVELHVHGGDDSFDRTRGNFRQGISGNDATGLGSSAVDRLAQAVGAYAAFEPSGLPGVEVGGFVGYNGSRNPHTAPDAALFPTLSEGALDEGRTYVSYAAHAYWGRYPGDQPLRFKADVLGIQYEEVGGLGGQHALGYALLAAAAPVAHGEVFARFEQFLPDADGPADTYVTAGASYSLSDRRGLAYRQNRVTLAYANALPDAGSDEHLVVLQWQFVF